LDHLAIAGVDAVEAYLKGIKLAAQGLELGLRLPGNRKVVCLEGSDFLLQRVQTRLQKAGEHTIFGWDIGPVRAVEGNLHLLLGGWEAGQRPFKSLACAFAIRPRISMTPWTSGCNIKS